MKKNKSFLLLTLLLIVLIAGASILYNKLSTSVKKETLTESSPKTPKEKTEESDKVSSNKEDSSKKTPSSTMEVPDFTVTDSSGKELKLSDFLGKPVILNFWASWCGPCKQEMPHFDEAYKKYEEDIHFVMVNLTDGARETKEKAEAFISEQGYSFPVYFDTKTEAAMAYGTYSIPVTYFIDANGKPVAKGNGTLDADTLQKGIDMLSEK